MVKRTLVVGSKNFSSWSLRPWLALRRAGIEFAEIVVALRRPETKAEIARYSPSGRVPVLLDDGLAIWDSLAICEYAAELAPQARLWPAEAGARAMARAASAEMHSGFAELRQRLPMEIAARHATPPSSPELDADIARVLALWHDCRARHGAGGPFLFGQFSIADAMYAPVATRFVTYGVALPAIARAYVESMVALPEMREWTEAAARET